MSYDAEFIVIGAGAMGSASAWQLARRGMDVILLEQFDLLHKNGASHGQTRNFNPAYPDPTYIAMIKEAFGWWQELEAVSQTKLLDLVGLINIAPLAENEDLLAKSIEGEIEASLVMPDEAKERWPGFSIEESVVFYPNAGPVRADDSLRAFHDQIRVLGGTILPNTRVLDLEVNDDVTISTETGQLRAKHVVVAAGGWSRKLLGDLLPPMKVTQEQPAHFPLISPTDVSKWPSFNHRMGDDPKYSFWHSGIYGLISPGEGLKVGWHGVGPETDPDQRTFTPDADQMADLQEYVRQWIPGVDWTSPAPISCTYTTTSDENFILDRRGPLTVAAGFSGHGFKFTPTVGRIIADLAIDDLPSPEIFRLGSERVFRHRRSII